MPVLSKGARVGDLEVVRKLGEGQFAEVWQVVDTKAAEGAPNVSPNIDHSTLFGRCVALSACVPC